MLLDFAHDVDRGRHVEAFRDHTECRVDRRKMTPFKFDVHYWANDLHYPAIHMTVRTASVSVRRSHTFANSSINSSLLKAKSRVGTKALENSIRRVPRQITAYEFRAATLSSSQNA